MSVIRLHTRCIIQASRYQSTTQTAPLPPASFLSASQSAREFTTVASVHALANMPCLHCASRDTTLVASTSNRCLSSVPVQRVLECGRTHKQIRRQIKRSHVAAQRAFSQLDPNRQQQTQQVETLHPQISVQQRPAQTQRQHQLGQCMVHGFAAAAFLSFLAPGPSYSAESLPVGLLKSWIVSFV